MSGVQIYYVKQKYLETSETTSADSGSLVVAGGIGINKSLQVGESAIIGSTLDSTDTTTGALRIMGGMSIMKKIYTGDNVEIGGNMTTKRGIFLSTEDSTSSDTGAVVISGGIGVQTNICVGNSITTNKCIISSTEISTSMSTGALIIAGGVGIVKDVNIGGSVKVDVDANITGDIIGKNINITGRNTITNDIDYGLKSIIYSSTGGYGVINENTTPDSSYIAFSCGGKTTNTEDHYDIIYNHVSDNNTTNNIITKFGTTPLTKISRDSMTICITTDSSDATTGSLVVMGGMGVTKNLHVAGSGLIDGILKINNTSPTLSSSTGSLIIAGGVGIANGINIGGDTTIDGTTRLQCTTNTTETGSGCLIVDGGVSISKNIVIGGSVLANEIYSDILHISSTDESTSTDTGSLIVSGGIGIAESVYIGANLSINGQIVAKSTMDAFDTNTGALIVNGGMGIAKALYIGAELHAGTSLYIGTDATVNETLRVLSTTNSSDTYTGALMVFGGMGLGENLNVGGNAKILNTENATSSNSGSMSLSGGIGIAKDIISGGQIFRMGNSNGEYEKNIVIMQSVIEIEHNNTATVYSLNITNPCEIVVQLFGYDNTTTYNCVCKTTYVFMIDGTSVVSINGNSGSPELLYSNKQEDGWNFSIGAFSFVDNGSGNVDIQFTHNGMKEDILTIGTVVVNKISGFIN